MAMLMTELPSHPVQVAFRNRWERVSEIYWELDRGRVWRDQVRMDALEVELNQLLRLVSTRRKKDL
jgi:hypothetical protein